MRKNNILILFVCFISLLFIIFSLTSVLAINATSSNYSVGRFGTGLAATTASSENYRAISITEVRGTTRNADSNEYITNIGFFSDTDYYRTVSISSYSIYPRTSYAVSSIRLSISAVNYDSLWASITRPDSVVEIVELTNNDYEYYTAGIVGRYNITFYANSSTGAISSVLDYFNVLEYTGGGGGDTGGDDEPEEEEEEEEEPCVYVWDCTPWGVCSNGIQTRECKNIGTCIGTFNKPIETMNCSEALFDVILVLKNLTITEEGKIIFDVNLTEKMGVNKIDISVKYAIINDEGYEIFSQIETKAVQGNLNYEKTISEINLSAGYYTLRVDALYGNLQRAFAEQKFRITKKDVSEPSKEEKELIGFFDRINYKLILIISLIIFLITIIVLLILILRRRSKERGDELIELKIKQGLDFLNKGKIREAKEKYKSMRQIYHLMIRGEKKNKIYPKIVKFREKLNKTMFIGILVLLPLLFTPFIMNKAGFTGNFLGTGSNTASPMFIVTLSLILLFVFILSVGKYIQFSNKNNFKNTISELLNKEVYSSEGSLIGKVKEVVLGKQRIESLVITLESKYHSSGKGIIVDYSNVKSVKNVVILNEKIRLNLD